MDNLGFRKAEDLVLDQGFCDYVLKDLDDNAYWKTLADSSEEQKAEFEKAKELLMLLSSAKKSKIPVDKQAELQKLLNKLENKGRVIKLSNKIAKYAAVFIIAFTCLLGITQIEFVKYKTYASSDLNKTIVLNDDSEVVLNSNSTIKVSRLYGTFNRGLKLDGEAFFEVSHNPDLKFEIACNNSKVKVLGTKFNVKTSLVSTQVTVSEGKVSFSANNSNQALILTKQMAATSNQDKGIEEISYNMNSLGWQTGEFQFNNLTLNEITDLLKTYYKVDFRIAEKFREEKLSFHVSEMQLNEVLDILQQLVPGMEYSINNNQITLK